MILSRLVYYIRIFSLDIVAGAMAALVYSSNVMGIELTWAYYAVLALSVWLIYLADHLMDGVKTYGKSSSETHNFFYVHKIPIILIFLMTLVFTFRLAMYSLDEKIIEFGMAPAVTTIVYLIMNRYFGKGFIKEMWIALIYTMAVWGGPVIYAGDRIILWQFLLIASFGLIIFGNVLIYSIYQNKSDWQEGNRSIATDFGMKPAIFIAIVSMCFAIIIPFIAFLFFGAGLIPMIPLVLISSGMLLIVSHPRVFSVYNRYGVFADLLLFLFLLVLIG